jgi:hypothetical protein
MTTRTRQLPSPEEQKRLLDNCDFHIDMFNDLARNCQQVHSTRCKERAKEQADIKGQLQRYFAGEMAYESLTYAAQEKMYVYPDWATKGT